jgi:hypothetical protein
MSWKRTWEKISNWELWPFELRYSLITPMWAWYCLRSRSVWFFTPSNPTITFGGFEGEDKREMYEQLPPELYPKTIYVHPSTDFTSVKQQVQERGFTYPFIVKPDVGMKGLLFRKLDNEAELHTYHQKVPCDYLIQDLVDYPLEISVFYYRYPGQQKGIITGFIQKDLMDVVGDGKSTLMQLISEHPKARHRLEEMRIKHKEHLDKVLPAKERYILTYAANLNRGARFTNLQHLIDNDLLAVFDKLSHQTTFYYGRYDIKCASVEDLKKGRNFSILEFNGSGAEPNHVYNSGYTLFQAYRVFLMHWKVLYRISKMNAQQGHPRWPFIKGLRHMQASKRHLKVLEALDTQILV